MAFSGMSPREKVAAAVLGGIILVALIGIGVLLAKLVLDRGAEQTTNITPPATAPITAATQEVPTLVPNPSLEEKVSTPEPAGAEPVIVVQVQSPGPLLPAILTNQPLHPGRSYRVEIVAADGSKTAIRGSWSHSARSADGKLEMPLAEPIEGMTPFRLDLAPPLPNAESWRLSVSAAPQDLLGQPPGLVVTVWDVSGSQ